jgi:hypothetical protein
MIFEFIGTPQDAVFTGLPVKTRKTTSRVENLFKRIVLIFAFNLPVHQFTSIPLQG